MFCSQCGKKVMDTMLFCPFCGSPIVIPDQEEAAPDVVPEAAACAPAPDETEHPSAEDAAANAVQAADGPDCADEPDASGESPGVQEPAEPLDAFVPLNLDIAWDREDVAVLDGSEENQPFDILEEPEQQTEPAAKRSPSDEISDLLRGQLQGDGVRLNGRVPNLTHVQTPQRANGGGKRRANTVAPMREFDPEDIFLDGGDRDRYDEDPDTEFEFEEPERGSFFVRHVRGIVSLSLMVILLIIMSAWIFSASGQTALARANLAWDPEVYEKLAYEAYQEKSYAVSGAYYAKALKHDPDNYDYANYAGIAYYMANDVERSCEMGKRAAAISPSRMEAYQLLLTLYPDEATRPWEISSLLQKGYEITGNEALRFD